MLKQKHVRFIYVHYHHQKITISSPETVLATPVHPLQLFEPTKNLNIIQIFPNQIQNDKRMLIDHPLKIKVQCQIGFPSLTFQNPNERRNKPPKRRFMNKRICYWFLNSSRGSLQRFYLTNMYECFHFNFFFHRNWIRIFDVRIIDALLYFYFAKNNAKSFTEFSHI